MIVGAFAMGQKAQSHGRPRPHRKVFEVSICITILRYIHGRKILYFPIHVH